MSRNQRHISNQKEYLVAGVAGSDLEPGTWMQVLEPHPALDLRLHDIPVYLIAEVGMWLKQAGGVKQRNLFPLDALGMGWLQI